MPRVVHFEIHASKPQQLVDFYSEVFGWKFQHMAEMNYWMIDNGEGPGINGGLFQRGDAGVTTLTMSVGSIEDAIATIEAEGGKVVQGKTPIPGMGWFATCEDTEGNRFGLFTNDESAS